MNTKKIDAFVYIQSQKGPYTSADIAQEIARLSGVVSAKVNRNVSKMVDIEYDPGVTSGNVILDFVRDSGYTSYLVGM